MSALTIDVLGTVVAVAAPRAVLAELRAALADLPTPDRGAERELTLTAHTVNLPALGGTALAWLAGLALAYPAYHLTYGDADEAVAAVRRAAAGPGRPAVPAAVLPAIVGDTTTVAVDDALAVLHEPSGKIHLLNAPAADVWRRAVGAVAPATGTADRAMTAATVSELVRAGLLAEAAGT